jgi:hypothetical protein
VLDNANLAVGGKLSVMSSFSNSGVISEDPPSELCRDVYAHYGLCMAASQLFETHLINVLTAYATDRDPHHTRQTYDKYLEKHERLTFGNLLQALTGLDYLSGAEALVLARKRDRDFLAHRFFRDRVESFLTVSGCKRLIDELESIRQRFDSTTLAVEAIETALTKKLGFHTAEFAEKVQRLTDEAEFKAKAAFSPNQTPH